MDAATEGWSDGAQWVAEKARTIVIPIISAIVAIYNARGIFTKGGDTV